MPLAFTQEDFLVLHFFYIYRGKVAVFTILCEQYQPSLKRDPDCNEVSVKSTIHEFPACNEIGYNDLGYNGCLVTASI